jgi:hypothetical protein
LLVEYEIQLEKFEVLTRNNVSQSRVKIIFRRRMEYHLSGTFLQTIILILIGYLSLLFDIDNFTDRIMVVLTTMLVVATIVTSMSEVSVLGTVS